ncbi:MAG: hypothetical protein GY772_13695, partial [bacterium]|nr:hypothetical protein [bacterium]
MHEEVLDTLDTLDAELGGHYVDQRPNLQERDANVLAEGCIPAQARDGREALQRRLLGEANGQLRRRLLPLLGGAICVRPRGAGAVGRRFPPQSTSASFSSLSAHLNLSCVAPSRLPGAGSRIAALLLAAALLLLAAGSGVALLPLAAALLLAAAGSGVAPLALAAGGTCSAASDSASETQSAGELAKSSGTGCRFSSGKFMSSCQPGAGGCASTTLT